MQQQDKYKYCPNCGKLLDDPRSFQNVYWNSSLTVNFCWCHACSWKGEIIRIDRIMATEPT